MNEPGAFEPFVDNIESILKREIPTPIMYEHLKYNEMLPTQTRRYLEPWKMPTPILRNPYASQVKPHQKQHPVYTLYKPFYIKKKRSSFAGSTLGKFRIDSNGHNMLKLVSYFFTWVLLFFWVLGGYTYTGGFRQS